MLQIGNNVLTHTEEQTHFALWAFAKAPLIIGCDLQTVSEDSLAILKNKNLIAINQDILGQQAVCAVNCGYEDIPEYYQVYTSQILEADGAHVGVLVVNWEDEKSVDVTLDLVELGIANS